MAPLALWLTVHLGVVTALRRRLEREQRQLEEYMALQEAKRQAREEAAKLADAQERARLAALPEEPTCVSSLANGAGLCALHLPAPVYSVRAHHTVRLATGWWRRGTCRYFPPTMAELDEQFMAVFGVTAQELMDFGELRSVDSAVGLVAAVAMVCLTKSNHVPHDLSWAGVRCVWWSRHE